MKDTGFSVPGRQARSAGDLLRTDPSDRRARRLRRARGGRCSQPARLRIGRRRAGLDGRRLSRLRPHDAEPGPARARAHPVAAVGRADDDRPDHARAECGLAVLRDFLDNRGWGFGVSIITQRGDLGCSRPVRLGRRLGTCGIPTPRSIWWVLMTQRVWIPQEPIAGFYPHHRPTTHLHHYPQEKPFPRSLHRPLPLTLS